MSTIPQYYKTNKKITIYYEMPKLQFLCKLLYVVGYLLHSKFNSEDVKLKLL